jgi:cytochrome P450
MTGITGQITRYIGISKYKKPPRSPGMPLLGNLLQARKEPLRFALDLTHRIGDVIRFRIGFYTGYLLNHPDYFHQVLKTNHHNYSKDNYNYRKLKPVLGEGLITADGDLWFRHRRLVQPAFHSKKIDQFYSIITNATGEMLKRWEDNALHQKPLPIDHEMMEVTLRIVTGSLFSTDIHSSVNIISKAFTILNEGISYRFKTAFVPPLWIPTPRNRKYRKARAQLDQIVFDIIGKRRSEKELGHDLLDMLMSARDESAGSVLTDREIRDEVMTLMLAGHETTANLLTWTCYLLSQNPDSMDKLEAELKEVLGNRDPEVKDIPKLKYARNVLEESLRLYPPVWIISRKAIHSDNIGGYHIPAGATVTLCSYTLHRHPGFWKDPEKFDPSRFSSNENGELSTRAYFPFGGGPRSCIGKDFAMMEAHVIMAMIFRRYRLKPMPDHPVEPEPMITLRPRYGLKIFLEKK